MVLLILGLVLFLGPHSFTMARGARARLIDRIGLGAYKGLYSVITIVGLVLIVVGYGNYRAGGYIQVWTPPIFTRHLALPLVWAAFVMLASAYFPGRIRSALKHPMLAAVKTWAVAHLISNGDLGSIILFGSFLVWAVVDRISVKRRASEGHGEPAPVPGKPLNDVIAVLLGTALFFIFAMWLHPMLIGVPVWPGRS